jgi:Uma2 family endonuclease
MVMTGQRRLTFQQYVDCQESRSGRYELVKGELVEMSPPTWLHFLIADYLATVFKQEILHLGQPWIALQGAGQQTTEESSRLPDISVVRLDDIYSALDQCAILESAAILVVEVVSESTSTQDYREKVKEYQDKGIAEYWIVDADPFGAAKYIGSPKQPTVSVYALVDRVYQVRRFQGDQVIGSPTFPGLGLTAEQVLNGGR